MFFLSFTFSCYLIGTIVRRNVHGCPSFFTIRITGVPECLNRVSSHGSVNEKSRLFIIISNKLSNVHMRFWIAVCAHVGWFISHEIGRFKKRKHGLILWLLLATQSLVTLLFNFISLELNALLPPLHLVGSLVTKECRNLTSSHFRIIWTGFIFLCLSLSCLELLSISLKRRMH